MFKICYMGCNAEHDSNFVTNRTKGWEVYIMLFVKTPFYLFTDNEKKHYSGNHFFLVNKNTPCHYGAIEEYYCNDWMLFDCEEELYNKYFIPYNTPIPIDETLSEYFMLISKTFFGINNNREKASSLLIDALLTFVAGSYNREHSAIPYYSELSTLRQQIYAHPEFSWSLSEISKMTGLSLSYFQEKYKDIFHVSCGADIINSRISAAKNLLKYTPSSIREISESCGYHSEIHFSRQFKKEVGMSPTKYRKTKK